MKRVPFKVAKTIKAAGYPLERFQTVSREQFEAGFGYKYCNDKQFYSESPSILHPEDSNTIDMYYCPTYLEVWLWLWQKKEIYIDIASSVLGTQMDIWDSKQHNIMGDCTVFYISPEEAIEQAIKYLVDNNLIK